MSQNEFVICPKCSNRNNPQNAYCWNCEHWLVERVSVGSRLPPRDHSDSFSILCGIFAGLISGPLLIFGIFEVVYFNVKILGTLAVLFGISIFIVPSFIGKIFQGKARDFWSAFAASLLVIGSVILLLLSSCARMFTPK